MPGVHTINDINTNSATQGGAGILPLHQTAHILQKEQLTQRLRNFFISIPILTIVVLFLSTLTFLAVQITTLAGGKDWGFYMTLNYSLILKGQVWRSFTYAFHHLGFFHLFFNMFSALVPSSNIERELGTLKYVYILVVLFVFFTGLIAAGIMNLVNPLSMAAGFSGVIFSLFVWEAKRATSISFFGLFTVPKYLYPIIMLLVIQILVPQASFIGHACGLVMGFIYSFGLLNFLIPSDDFWNKLEKRLIPHCIYKSNRYIKAGGLVPLAFEYTVNQPTPSNAAAENTVLNNSLWLAPAVPTTSQSFMGKGRTLGSSR